MTLSAMPTLASPQDPVFAGWVDNHPFGLPGEMTCNDKGTVLYAAEGGGIAFLNPSAGDPASMQVPIKRLRVGREGVRASNMALDPDADVPVAPEDFVPGPANLIYVAGGRHGLWAMDADPRKDVENLAVRLDDSGSDAENGQQESRRWCNAVAFFSILKDGDSEPTDYLVALFARKRNNRLRIYELSRARAAFASRILAGVDPANEHGHELALGTDGFSIKVQRNTAVVPLASLPVPPPEAVVEVDFAYAMDMDVAQVSATEAHVFIALGMHGLVRVVIDQDVIDHHLGSGGGAAAVVEAGPYFGDGSPHAVVDPIYGHLALYEANEDSSLPPVLRHYERPLFLDVAVLNAGNETALFAAVDHLGWVKFSLGSHAFGPVQPILHHEGTIVDVSPPGFPAGSTRAVALRKVSGSPELSYAYRIAVDRVTDGGTSKTLVTVVTGDSHGRLLEAVHNEGRALNWVGDSEGKINKKTKIAGAGPRTFLYLDGGGDLQEGSLSGTAEHLNSTVELERGGFFAHAPPAQDTASYLLFLGKFVLRDQEVENSLERGRVDFSSGTFVDQIQREVQHRPGRFSPFVGTLPDHPETTYDERQVVIAGINDESIPYGDLLYLDGGDHLSGTPQPDSNGGGFGGWFQDQAVWPDSLEPGSARYWAWSAGRLGTESYFNLKHFEIDASSGAPSWTKLEEYFIPAPEDPIFTRGAYYAGGFVDPAFDAELGREFLFVVLAGSRQSIYVLDRTSLTTKVPGDDGNVELIPNSNCFEVTEDAFWTGFIEKVDLSAVHQECRDMPPGLSQPLLGQVRDRAHAGAVGALSPRLAKLGARWILAVPGWTMVVDPLDNVVGQWATSASTWREYSKMFVRFYDLTDIGQLPPSPLDRPTLVGPDLQSTAIFVEYLQVGGTTYLFVGDFMGKLWVYDVSGLETTTSVDPDEALDLAQVEFASWALDRSFSDDLQQNLSGLTLDVVAGTSSTRYFVYVSGWRLGTRILEFFPDPGLPVQQRLQDRGLIQGTYHLSQVRIREDVGGGGRRAFVADNGAGFLVLEEE